MKGRSRAPCGLHKTGVGCLIDPMVDQSTRDETTTPQSVQAAKMTAMSKLAAGVAHEINNPCGVLLMKLKFLLSIASDEQLSARAIATLEVAVQQTERIETIVESLVRFSRPMNAMPCPVDVSATIGSVIEGLSLPDSIELKRILAEVLPTIVADPAQIEQVFTEIIDNAVGAMPDGGTLTISSRVEHDPTMIQVEITDTGAGIPADFIERIFDPFFTTKSVGQGTGLGLTVSYGIIQRAGGQIEVESERGVGTCVRVVLPAKDSS